MTLDPKNIRRPKVRSALGERSTEQVGRLNGWRVEHLGEPHWGVDLVSIHAPLNLSGYADSLWLAPKDARDLVAVLMAAGARKIT